MNEPLEISWHVTNTDTGTAFANKPVWLIVNANSGGYQRTTFSYQTSSGTKAVSSNDSGLAQTQIAGTTDSNGNVTFSLKNTNSVAQAEPTPTYLNKLQPWQNINLASYITLTARSSAIREQRVFMAAHFAKPASALLWSDEFSGASGQAPNDTNWSVVTGDGCPDLCGWGNDEKEFYTDNASYTNGAGKLVIDTKKLTSASGLSCYPSTCRWSSGKFTSKAKINVQYGLVEARIKVAGGPGTWPAFWMLGKNIDQVGWPFSGEIDIMETAGNDPAKVSGTTHSNDVYGEHIWNTGYMYTSDDTYKNYHTFSVLWQPNRIDWFLDGENYYSLTKAELGSSPWVFNAPFYIIFNTAMGGGFGGPIASYLTSATTSIDWVRVYQYGQHGCVTTPSSSMGNCP